MKLLVISIIFILVSACSTIKQVIPEDKLNITCDVKNCLVVSSKSIIIGPTPLLLNAQKIKQITNGKFINFKIIKKGFLPKEVSLFSRNIKKVKIKMTPVDDKNFEEWVLGRFLKKTNNMSRKLLEIQALLISGRFKIAKKQLELFQEKYPNVSSSYTMMANILINEKNINLAESFLLRAIELDKKDSTARRLLKNIKDIL